MRVRTANHHCKRLLRKSVTTAAFDYDMARIERLTRAGRLDKRVNSGFVRRLKRKQKAGS